MLMGQETDLFKGVLKQLYVLIFFRVSIYMGLGGLDTSIEDKILVDYLYTVSTGHNQVCLKCQSQKREKHKQNV